MKWSRRLSLPCLGAALALAACGSDNGDNASTGSKTAAQQPASKPAVAAPPTTPPTEVQVTEPLSKTPPKGKKVIFLQCELPACSRYVNGAKQASKALGWSTTFQVFKNTAPAAALAQAVAQKPDYIFISGIPVSVLKAPLAQAKAAKIPVFSAADPDKPSAAGFALQVGGTLVPDAENIAKWIVNDSGGKASLVAVTIPQFPVLVGQTDYLKSELPKMCSGCKYDELDVTVEDVGAGAVPAKLTGYLQAHPDVNYVFFTFGDLGKGMGKVLQRAGLRSKVKLTGCCGDSGNAKELMAGDTDAWTIAPNEYSSFAAYDGMARLSIGEDPATFADKVFGSPSWVVDSKASVEKYLAPTNFDWHGPAGYPGQFEKLWQVGA
jgi:ribose transport system substrate-binding protein